MFSPFGSRRDMTSLQQEPSANSPWTKTMFLALGGLAIAGAAIVLPDIKDAAAPATSVVENVRLFIIMSGSCFFKALASQEVFDGGHADVTFSRRCDDAPGWNIFFSVT
jgi:hypothetical protein